MAMDWDTKGLADKAGVSQIFVRNDINAGRLRAHKLGGVWLIVDEDAQEWLANPRRGSRRKKGVVTQTKTE